MVLPLQIDRDLALRAIGEADAEALFALIDQNRDHLRAWLPWLDANTSIEQTRSFIRSVLEQDEQGLGFCCTVVVRGRLVGIIGYKPIQWADRSVEIGYWLDRDAVGRGYMTRSCRELVEHAFAGLGLRQVRIRVAVGNLRSRAIPERLGFTPECVIANAEWLYDHSVDHILYLMRSGDWTGATPDRSGGGAA